MFKFGFENFSRSTQNLFKKEPFEEIELVLIRFINQNQSAKIKSAAS